LGDNRRPFLGFNIPNQIPMQPIIICKNCGTKISIDEALFDQQIQEAKQIAKREAEDEFKKLAKDGEEKVLQRANEKFAQKMKDLEEEREEDKKENRELREQLKQLMQEVRQVNKDKENKEIEMQKKLIDEEKKIREEAEKAAAEKQNLITAEKDKQLNDARKMNAELERKLHQGSQQMQGEVLELELEKVLSSTFKDDEITPVQKGVNGADVCHTVQSPMGRNCGIILWETKRTKNWTEGWIDKLKADCLMKKANIPVIITEVMPKDLKRDIELYRGVWIAKPNSIVPLATLLRKSLLDVERQKALAENHGTKSEALYTFITSHEFAHQVESMVEIYVDMREQVQKERTAYERLWALREKQAQKLLNGTANIIGSMQGQIGHTAMPRIKGLDLMELPSVPDEDSL